MTNVIRDHEVFKLRYCIEHDVPMATEQKRWVVDRLAKLVLEKQLEVSRDDGLHSTEAKDGDALERLKASLAQHYSGVCLGGVGVGDSGVNG